MSGFLGIGSDGSGYVNDPQETVRRDVPLLAALEKAPQDDALVRHEERQVAGEMSQALHQLQHPHQEVTEDQVIDQLMHSIMQGGNDDGGNYNFGSGVFGNGGGGFGFNQPTWDRSQNNSSNPYLPPGIDQGPVHGGGYSNGYANGLIDGLGIGHSGGGSGGGHHYYDPGQTRFDQPFAGLYNGGRGADGSYSAYDNKGTTGAAAGSQFQMNSDGTVTSPDLKQVFSGAQNGNAHPDLLHLSRQDYPGGFALNSDAKDGNTHSVNGEVDGHKVEVWTDNDGKVKAQVDGKPVDANNPDPNGIVKSNSDGSYTITGRDDKTNASIDVRVGANNPNGQHRGLTTTVSNVNGPGGNPLHVGGFLGNALSGHNS